MDGDTLQSLRDALLQRWNKTHRASQATGRDIDENLSTPQAEIIDIAQGLEQIGRDVSLAEQERRELLAVERALAKMATGNFGFCEDCSEEIPPKRLQVLPEARLCANCQAVEERQNSRIRPPGVVAR